MCCFSRPVISVSGTNIFARPAEDDRQFVVYSMTLDAKDDLAMILPLPVKVGAGEDALDFVDLSGHPEFFDDLLRGFPPPVTKGSRSSLTPLAATRANLKVVQVGSFEASFVPTVNDFTRLDERFRLPANTWAQLPGYSNHGFAVFKLKSGNTKVHPMAFSFPRRDTKTLFLPTVHIHDGKVHPKADFDHALYCQPSANAQPEIHGWEESYANAGRFMQVDKAKGLILADQHCYRKELGGRLPNRDNSIIVSA